jgi:hypothetical protein
MSPYLAQRTRELWEVCQKRQGWHDIADAPCDGCPLAAVCDRQWDHQGDLSDDS